MKNKALLLALSLFGASLAGCTINDAHDKGNTSGKGDNGSQTEREDEKLEFEDLEDFAKYFYEEMTGEEVSKIGDYMDDDDYYNEPFLKYDEDGLVFYEIYFEEETNAVKSFIESAEGALPEGSEQEYKDEEDDGSTYFWREYKYEDYYVSMWGGFTDEDEETFSSITVDILNYDDLDAYNELYEESEDDYSWLEDYDWSEYED